MSEFSGWMGVWLLRTLLSGGVLLITAWLGLLLTGDAARRQRLAAWTFRGVVLAAILGLFPAWLLIPVKAPEPEPVITRINRTPPKLELPAPPEAAVWEKVPAVEVAGEYEVIMTDSSEPVAAAVPVVEPVPVPEPVQGGAVNWKVWLIGAYVAVTLFAAAQLALAFVALRRLRKRAVTAPEAVRNLVDELCGAQVTPEVLVSTMVPSPVCFGWRKPVILIPQRLLETARGEELRWVLVHELEHLRRGDPRTGLWVALARVLYFAVPWFWAVRRELRLAQEYLADAAAAAGRRADYAAFLVSLSETPARRAPLGAVAVRAGSSDLYRRISMLTQGKTPRGCSRAWSLFTASGVLSAAVALSGVGFADEPKPKVVELEVVVVDDDAPKPKDGEKKKDVIIMDGAKKADVLRYTTRVTSPEEVQKLTKAVNSALEKGDVAVAKDAMAKLEKLLAAQPKVVGMTATPKVFEFKAAPIAPPAPPAAPGVPAPPAFVEAPLMRARVIRLNDAKEDEATKKMEEKLESLKKALEQVKDQPEAREALEKTIAEFKKKIAEARKEGELKIAPPAADNLRIVPRMAVPLDDDVRKQMEKARADMARAMADLEKQMADLNGKDANLDAQRKALMEKALEFYRKNAELNGQMPPMAFFPGGVGGPGGGALFVEGQPFAAAGLGAPRGGRFGISLGSVPEALADQLDLGKTGVMIQTVAPGSAAEKAGLKANDVLVSVKGKSVSNDPNAAAKLLGDIKSDEKFDITLIRKGKKETIKDITMPAAPKKGEVSDSDKPKETGSNFNSMQVQVNNDEFTIKAKNDGFNVTVTGRLEDGKKIVESVSGSRDGKEFSAKDLDKLSKQDREAVEQLLKSVGGGRK